MKTLKASHDAALVKVDEVSRQLKEERLKSLQLEKQIQTRALDQRRTQEVFIYLHTYFIYSMINAFECAKASQPVRLLLTKTAKNCFSATEIKPSVRPSIRSSVHPSVRPSVRSSVHPSVRPFIHPYVRPSIHLSIRPSIYPSSLSIYLFTVYSNIYIYIFVLFSVTRNNPRFGAGERLA